MTTPYTISPYARIVGDVIRRHRKAKGWTRKQLKEKLTDSDISLQTLATYELATRHISVDRLDELARALGTRAHMMLAEADQRMYSAPDGKFVVNLATLAASTRPDIAPAAKWAAIRLTELDSITAKPTAELSGDSLDMLANLCDLDTVDLFGVLREFAAR